jgi:hypothetical protein
MSRAVVILSRTTEVTDALAEIGLSFDVLRDAMLAGEIARDSCIANDPSNAAGFDAWARTVRALRERLTLAGWGRDDSDGLPTAIAPTGDIAIVVATGDEATGDRDKTPKTKYSKGPATVAVVESNSRQGDLFRTAVEGVGIPNRNLKTYFLLRRRVDDFVFSELSEPDSIGDDGRVEDWARRMILDPISLNPQTGGGLPDRGEEINVSVRRRQN